MLRKINNEFDVVFRFNEFSRDLDDLMATLEHDFRKQDTYLTKDWHKKIMIILTKKKALDGIASNALPKFLNGVTTIISLEVRYALHSFTTKTISHTLYIR